MRVTNKKIYEELRAIEKSIPDTNNHVTNMQKTIKQLSYGHTIIKNDIKEIAYACENKEFGCGNNK